MATVLFIIILVHLLTVCCVIRNPCKDNKGGCSDTCQSMGSNDKQYPWCHCNAGRVHRNYTHCGVPRVKAVCPPNWNYDHRIDRCRYLLTGIMPWSTAHQKCVEVGSTDSLTTLVQWHTAEPLSKVCDEFVLRGMRMWSDANDRDISGVFRWGTSNITAAVIPWRYNHVQEDTSKRCLLLSQDCRITRESCNANHMALCELSGSYRCIQNNMKCDDLCLVEHSGVRTTCTCRPGYTDDHGKCVDVDECAIENTCPQNCVNEDGGYHCTCKEGYTVHTSGHCKDIEECADLNGECQHICQNSLGSFRCVCMDGYKAVNTTQCTEIEGSIFYPIIAMVSVCLSIACTAFAVSCVARSIQAPKQTKQPPKKKVEEFYEEEEEEDEYDDEDYDEYYYDYDYDYQTQSSGETTVDGGKRDTKSKHAAEQPKVEDKPFYQMLPSLFRPFTNIFATEPTPPVTFPKKSTQLM